MNKFIFNTQTLVILKKIVNKVSGLLSAFADEILSYARGVTVDKVRNIKYSGPQAEYRNRLNVIFKIREKVFFKKKPPESENYPFSLVDPFEVFGEDHPYGDFNLVGEDWKDRASTKPVAILWGFNNWKLGFVSAYLPEYRTAFAPRKMLGWTSLIALRRFPIRPATFIFWGYTESWLVRSYAEKHGIKMLRMEDGFLRSSALGASHSTPYSLILDTKGLHYNPEVPSDIEDILSNHEFSEEELKVAQECMDLMKSLRLSKYNPATLGTEKQTAIKVRRRVAVLGQVDNDMSVRLGNPDGWSMIELIRLAKIENPDSDIYYRPHPDIYKGFQRSRFRHRAVAKYCKIASPDIPLVDFLDTVDHVYTLTSLSGLEALLRGIKVTVVGAAFYAGWGLTDDRVSFPRRKRMRLIVELFSAIYMKYPRYLAKLGDAEIGFKAACYRIKADLEINKYDLCCNLPEENSKIIDTLVASEFWPMVLFKIYPKLGKKYESGLLNKIDYEVVFGAGGMGRLFQTALIYAVCGQCIDNEARNIFLSRVRKYVDHDILNELLLDLNESYPGPYIAANFAWLLKEAGEGEVSAHILEHELANANKLLNEVNLKDSSDQVGGGSDSNVLTETNDERSVDLNKSKSLLYSELHEHYISLRKLDFAVGVAKGLLLGGEPAGEFLYKVAKDAEILFDYRSALGLARLLQYVDVYSRNRNATLIEAKSNSENDIAFDNQKFIVLVFKLIALKPDRISDVLIMLRKYKDHIVIKNLEEIVCSSFDLDNEQSIRKAQGYIAIENVTKAKKIIENLNHQGQNDEAIRIAYSQVLSYAGRLDQALLVMQQARLVRKTSDNYRETLRLYVLAGLYDEGLALLNDARARKIELGDMHPRKIYFGSRMVKEAFQTFTEFSLRNTVATYYKDKYCSPQLRLAEDQVIFLLAIFGPGDEIRFASIYNLIQKYLPPCKVRVACSPRLKTLFERSFPQFDFVPVERPRKIDLIDMRNYSHVPGSDLTGVVDNTAVAAIDDSSGIMLVTDLLHECLEKYSDFPGIPYLKHNEALTPKFHSMLPTGKKLVGLSWRSSLTTHSRNEHYLTVEELEPIFSIEGVQFVNFQYDECSEELAWIEARHPGKVINIEEIDHYNDFESVSALMKCMDLMIAPATTVVELSGALGCPTWLLSNSSELFWRKIDDQGTDVWHNCITHVEGKELGNKESLVIELNDRLIKYSLN